jgi:formiminoglutamase
VFNLGTNDGKSTHPALQEAVTKLIAASGQSWVVNGRFKGGYITRHHGQPEKGVYALQMELACRGYMREPEGKSNSDNWPAPYDPDYAAPIRSKLTEILETALAWARG